jgi:hypothetical protein
MDVKQDLGNYVERSLHSAPQVDVGRTWKHVVVMPATSLANKIPWWSREQRMSTKLASLASRIAWICSRSPSMDKTIA